MTGTARMQSRLPKITRPSYTHLGQSQGSTQPQCNGRASPWGNRLLDHGNPYARRNMLELFKKKTNRKLCGRRWSLSDFRYYSGINLQRVAKNIKNIHHGSICLGRVSNPDPHTHINYVTVSTNCVVSASRIEIGSLSIPSTAAGLSLVHDT